MASRDLDALKPEGAKSLDDAFEREIARIVPLLLEDLRRRDESTEEGGSSFLYTLVAESSMLGELQTEIEKGLSDGDFTMEDIASRFVGFSYLVGGSGRPASASFSGGLFTKVTGLTVQSADRDKKNEWSDTTWPRRREFARQFLERATDDAPASTNRDSEAKQ